MKIYHQGTLEQFNIWHNEAKNLENIKNGGMYYTLNDEIAINSETTKSYCIKIPHPINSNSYIWHFGDYKDILLPEYSLEEVVGLGWFQNSGF